MASKYLYYTDINDGNDTIIFKNVIFNKDTFGVDYYSFGSLTLQSNWRFKKDIILRYKDNEEVYLPKIDLYNINSLKINSNCCDKPKACMLNYMDLKKISFNNQPILIRNLKIITPGNDPLSLLNCQIRFATNDWWYIF